MAIVSFADIYSAVRSRLNDTEVAGGRIYTDAFQADFLYDSYEKLFKELHIHGLKGGTRTVYLLLPPRTSVIVPTNWAIPNFGMPEQVWTRPVLGSASIPLSPLPYYDTSSGFVTLTPNDSSFFNQGDTLEVIGERRCNGDVNGQWTVDKGLNNATILNGCKSALSGYSGTDQGKIVKGSGDWVMTTPITRYMNLSPGVLVPAIDAWFYQSGNLIVPPCSVQQEIQITFKLSATLNAGDPDSVLGIDGAGSFLIYDVAAACADSKGAPQKAKSYWARAEQLLSKFIDDRMKANQAFLYESGWMREFTYSDPAGPRGREYYTTGGIGSGATGTVPVSGGTGTVASVQIPTGTMDGSNDTFAVTNVTGYNTVQVVWNGVVLQSGTGYILSGTVLTMQPGYIPSSGDTLEVYFYV